MSITQTVDIPASRRLTIEVPGEVPVGKTILEFRPVAEKLPAVNPQKAGESATPNTYSNADIIAGRAPTPIADSLVGILSGLSEDDIGDDLRMEGILRKHAKYLFEEKKKYESPH